MTSDIKCLKYYDENVNFSNSICYLMKNIINYILKIKNSKYLENKKELM